MLTQCIAKKMMKRGNGKIIFMSSVVGILSGPFVGIYGASKHAIEAIAEAMSMALRKFGVQVAVINPDPAAQEQKGTGKTGAIGGAAKPCAASPGLAG